MNDWGGLLQQVGHNTCAKQQFVKYICTVTEILIIVSLTLVTFFKQTRIILKTIYFRKMLITFLKNKIDTLKINTETYSIQIMSVMALKMLLLISYLSLRIRSQSFTNFAVSIILFKAHIVKA